MGDLSIAEWQKQRRAIIDSREGCDCPNAINGKLVPRDERCSRHWIRCNGAANVRFDRLEALGPKPEASGRRCGRRGVKAMRERDALRDVEGKLQDAADAVARIIVDMSLPGLTRAFAQRLMVKVAKLQVEVEEEQSRAKPLELLGGHVHTCPECYEHVPCEQFCAVEPDLDLDDGTVRGSHVACAACAPSHPIGTGEPR